MVEEIKEKIQVVPKCVDNWYKWVLKYLQKQEATYQSFIETVCAVLGSFIPEEELEYWDSEELGYIEELGDWYYSTENSLEILINLPYGYAVEDSETLYVVVDNHQNPLICRGELGARKARADKDVFLSLKKSNFAKWKRMYVFTEEEIKSYDERFWEFAEEV